MKNIDIDLLEEFANKLQDITTKYKEDVPEKYIDWLTEIWSEALDEIKIEQDLQKEKEQEEHPSYYIENDEYANWQHFNSL